MKRMSNKGQGAMEYLMTYGWAILVVMIVGIVMWQLGIFNMGSTAVTSSGFSRLKPQLAAISLKNTDAVFLFTNGAGGTIDASTATFTGDASVTASPVQVSVGAGDNVKYSGVNLATGAGDGDPVSIDVAILYDITVGGVTTTHTERGTIRGPIE